MRIALLADGGSIHTARWVDALAERDHEIDLLTIRPEEAPLHGSVRVHRLPYAAPFGYFTNVLAVRRILSSVQPDVLHAHFASGYGTLGRLSGYRPYILSVWGSDVYDFPYRSILHRWGLRANLRAADHVVSISEAMMRQTSRLQDGLEISVVPWGIDPSQFCPAARDRPRPAPLIIGTIKALRPVYGIDVLIAAFARVRSQIAGGGAAVPLRLLVVGGGEERGALEAQARRLGVDDATTFVGRIPHAEVAAHLNQLDIYVAVSRRESFGVAVVEASACELPVVVSDVGGLPEVVEAGTTGFVVGREDVEATADALRALVEDSALRQRMGEAGRRRVLEHYEWSANVTQMERVYERVLQGPAARAQSVRSSANPPLSSA